MWCGVTRSWGRGAGRRSPRTRPHPEDTHKAEARVDFYTESSDRKGRRLLACAREEEEEEEEEERVCVEGEYNKTLRYICFAICNPSLPPSPPLSILPHPLSKSTGDRGSS
ncbi:unnamed protein product [Pleuronectes platessa]|uniref:Uncharacterized protein n=1 Tax=Pleuronectes platessa TaxID=8262 RepID=A0A9N7YUI7_PLEPL|nr:unnamed protein product [Pleuronectes platessa]